MEQVKFSGSQHNLHPAQYKNPAVLQMFLCVLTWSHVRCYIDDASFLEFQVCCRKGSRLAIWISPICWTFGSNWLSGAVLAFTECSRSGRSCKVCYSLFLSWQPVENDGKWITIGWIQDDAIFHTRLGPLGMENEMVDNCLWSSKNASFQLEIFVVQSMVWMKV